MINQTLITSERDWQDFHNERRRRVPAFEATYPGPSLVVWTYINVNGFDVVGWQFYSASELVGSAASILDATKNEELRKTLVSLLS